MAIKKEFYEEIYFVDSPEYFTDKQWDCLLMSVSPVPYDCNETGNSFSVNTDPSANTTPR